MNIINNINNKYLVYNVGFLDSLNNPQETQLDVVSLKDLYELIESLRAEMDINKITYIELVGEEE